jgi:hypothetical protein
MGTPTAAKATPSRPTGLQSLMGDIRISAFTFTFSTTYASPGGEVFDPKTTNPNEVGTVIAVIPVPPANATVIPVWDPVNKKLKAYWVGLAFSGVLAEVANGSNLSVTPGPITVLVLHR